MGKITNNKDLEFDKEVRDIYRERNSQSFNTPQNKSSHKKILLSNIFTWLVVVIISSLVTVITVVTFIEPASPLTLIERTKAVPKNESISLSSDKLLNIQKSTVAIFSNFGGSDKTGFDMAQVALTKEALGQGLVLSSDGWVVTSKQVTADNKNLWIAAADGYMHKVEMMVSDPVAPLVYLKIKATNLPATTFVDYGGLTVGEAVWASAYTTQNSQPVLYSSRLASLNGRDINSQTDLVASTDKLDDKYLLDTVWSKGLLGAPVINDKGEVLGLVSSIQGSTTTVLPIYHITSVIDNLFTNQQIKRPSLGVQYVHAETMKPFGTETLKTLTGALVTQAKAPSVTKGSKAVEQLIKAGDIILEIDGQKINSQTLANIVQQARPGAQLDIVVKRDFVETKLSVTLGEIVSLPTVLTTTK